MSDEVYVQNVTDALINGLLTHDPKEKQWWMESALQLLSGNEVFAIHKEAGEWLDGTEPEWLSGGCDCDACAECQD